MSAMIRRVAPLALLLLAACQPAPGLEPPGGGEAAAAIFGVVKVPKRLVAMPSPPAYPNPPSPTPAGSEWGVEGAEVFCADAAGTRIPGIARVETNEDGAYRLHGVPIGYAYVVTAVYRDLDGRPLRLRTLARVTAGPVEAPLDLATTVAAEAVLEGRAGLLTGYAPEPWGRLVQGARARVAPEGPTDPGDPFLVAAAIGRLRAEDPAWAADVDALRAGLGASPAPTPSPSPTPSASPSP